MGMGGPGLQQHKQGRGQWRGGGGSNLNVAMLLVVHGPAGRVEGV